MTFDDDVEKDCRFAHALALLCEVKALARELEKNPPLARKVEIIERMFAIRQEVSK